MRPNALTSEFKCTLLTGKKVTSRFARWHNAGQQHSEGFNYCRYYINGTPTMQVNGCEQTHYHATSATGKRVNPNLTRTALTL